MFENLQYADLSGLKGYISYEYSNVASQAGSLVMGIAGAIALLIVVVLFTKMLEYSYPKSRRYREFLSDMFVVGMIKKYAKDESINLDEETINYRKLIKLLETKNKNLDSIIEDNLKEKIAESQEKLTKPSK